jgi:hypothetical protein
MAMPYELPHFSQPLFSVIIDLPGKARLPAEKYQGFRHKSRWLLGPVLTRIPAP